MGCVTDHGSSIAQSVLQTTLACMRTKSGMTAGSRNGRSRPVQQEPRPTALPRMILR
ncbi:hypothetical protein B0T26DRAFT_691889 [Lasiosphaeria miniovina]|uniref:Uncharacterized protein n=1 Tax=Lasiosphaeria miniovina TaxID=1954250 RepID=A0AA40B379_9PEZI|nr:uncharacterized protein B0T26DRAFT_691889 [Lasiosphaeria miniovina]KAK0726824.1 hypothetical protein B0T26DRAFT_691889 [Lasiosphaeria miniovina]